MEEEDIHTKQQFLRSEIIDQGYDPSDFNTFMCSIRQEENIDLNTWTLQDLRGVVDSFKKSLEKEQEMPEDYDYLSSQINENLNIENNT